MRERWQPSAKIPRAFPAAYAARAESVLECARLAREDGVANIDRAFVTIGLAWLLLGMLLGLHMGATADNRFLDVHIAMVLPGFVVLSLYGAFYRLWPAMKQAKLAKTQFWVAAIAELGLVAGTFQFNLSGGTSVGLVAGASVLAILAAALMLWNFWSHSGYAN